MARKKSKKNLNKYFVLFFSVALVFAGGILFISSRNYLAQRPCGCELDSTGPSGEFNSQETQAFYDNQLVGYPLAELKPKPDELAGREKTVLGVADNRWVEIDLSDQKLYAHEGDQIVY